MLDGRRRSLAVMAQERATLPPLVDLRTFRCREHLVAIDKLDARAVFRLSESDFVGIQRLPALQVRVLNVTALQKVDNGLLVGVLGAPPVGLVVHDVLDGFHRV